MSEKQKAITLEVPPSIPKYLNYNITLQLSWINCLYEDFLKPETWKIFVPHVSSP
jgi:hypothetical protein